MFFLLFSVMLFGLLLCGVGCLFGKLLGYSSPRNPWIYFWLGFFIVSTLSMFGSFFVPVNIVSLIIFFIVGSGGLFFFYREYMQSIARCNKVETQLFNIITLLIFIVIVCSGAYKIWYYGVFSYDTDLYHAQTIRWYNEYGTPPGLGNLHARLAFNSSWLSLAALFDNGIWDGRSAWIMPSLALLGGVFYFFHELLFSRKNGIRLFALCILVWILLKVITRTSFPSLAYDYPALVVNAIIVLEAYYITVGYSGSLSKKEILDFANLLMLGVSAFMIKPIGAVALLFSGVLTLFLLVRNTKQTITSWFIIYTPALCALAVWITKNILLSGYLMYPLPIFAMPFDWTMPFGLADANYKDILSWARMPGPSHRQSLENGFLFWFGPWLIRNLESKFFLPLVVFPFFFSIITWFLVVRYADMKKAFYFLIWTFSSIVYWFMSAPALRFGDGFFWVCLGAAFLFLVPDTSSSPIPAITKFFEKTKRRIVFFCLCSGLCIFFLTGYALFVSSKGYELRILTIGTIPSQPVREYTVNSNPPFIVWIAASGDQTGNSPLPSTPYAPSNLEMREPGNLGKGFRPMRR